MNSACSSRRGAWRAEEGVGEAEHRMAAVVRTEKRKVAAARQAAADADAQARPAAHIMRPSGSLFCSATVCA